MIADRVKETTSTTGTGNLTLLGATAQFQSFNTAFGTSTAFYYVITDANGADWEVGTGQLTNATTLQRTTVHQSSNADAKINLSSGTHTVFCAAPEVFLSGLAPKSGKLSQFAATTSAELAGVISDETGTGSLVFSTSPSLTTPSLGAATATSVNGTTIPSSKTLVVTTDKLSALAATTSAELATVISDETGSGKLVFATSPTLTTPDIGVATATSVNGTTIPSSKTLLVDGGALGTPSSGTVTNLTGTASININGTVGATTPTTGAFTTLSSTQGANFATSSGNVGIGTSSPGYKLQVSGTAADIAATDSSVTTRVISSNSFAAGFIETTTNHPLIVRTNQIERMRIDSSGNVLVNQTSADGRFAVTADGSSQSAVYVRDSATGSNTLTMFYFVRNTTNVGTIQTTNTATSYNTSSDRRLKENIAPAGSAQAILDAIQIVQHDWKAGGHTRFGVVAQDLNEVYPEAVAAGDDGDVVEKSWGVDYSKLIPVLVKAIQELKAEIEVLKAGN